MEERTTITVDTATWRRLMVRKSPGDSFDDVINQVLDDLEELEEE